MKNLFLLIVVPVLLIASGIGQTPAPISNTDQASIKGCLGGSDGNYTVAEDGTTQTFKITSSTVDLKAHVGHDIEVVGQKANSAASSGSSDNSVTVTAVSMISEHCATASAGAPAATTSTPATVDTSTVAPPSTPVVPETIPIASSPALVAPAPVVADPTPAETASAPKSTSSNAPERTEQLPHTATSLPLLGLLGLGLLGLGLLSRKSRTN